eukprot:10231332-Karenia_brevis.AAC.1
MIVMKVMMTMMDSEYVSLQLEIYKQQAWGIASQFVVFDEHDEIAKIERPTIARIVLDTGKDITSKRGHFS